MHNKYQILPRNMQDEIDAFGDMITMHIDAGWTPFLITLMFRHISGSEAHRFSVMLDETKRAYSIHAKRVGRHFRSEESRAKMSRWFMLPDFPIFKFQKQSLKASSINDGQHIQGIYLLHSENRLKKSPTYEFRDERHRYTRPDRSLTIIDAKLIDKTPRDAVDYICKALKTGRADRDQLFILPDDR
ncbi:hypothetical protein [Mesorhizobium sp. M0676]|uniref:hypothetical protein n=1 Tax=Mesorhizobium sp. M0676 TaxID=2956984 RepID=UPI0033370B84